MNPNIVNKQATGLPQALQQAAPLARQQDKPGAVSKRKLAMPFLMSSFVPTYRTLRMSSCGIPGGGEQIHEDRGRKGVDMSFGVGYRGDIAVENTQLWLEEIPSASMTIRYIKRMYVYTYIYVRLPPLHLPHPPRINSKWLDYCADARRLSSFERLPRGILQTPRRFQGLWRIDFRGVT